MDLKYLSVSEESRQTVANYLVETNFLHEYEISRWPWQAGTSAGNTDNDFINLLE